MSTSQYQPHKSDLSIGYVDSDQGGRSSSVIGLQKALGSHFEVIDYFTPESRKFGNKSTYYRMANYFIDWWLRNFLDNDYDVYIFTNQIRAQDLRMVEYECWAKIPIVYFQHASCTLWGEGYDEHRRRDVDEFQNYLFSDIVLMYSQFQADRIRQYSSRYFVPQVVEEIQRKIRVVPISLDWKNRFQSTDTIDLKLDELQIFSAKSVDWLSGLWNSRVDQISVDTWRKKNRPPVFIFNSRLDATKEPYKLADVFKQLERRGIDFKVIFSIPFTANASNIKKLFEQMFGPFLKHFIVLALDPSWEMYNLLLNAADYWVGTNNDEHFCVSLQDAWLQKVMPVLPDCQIYREVLPPELYARHLFDDFSPGHAVDKIQEFEKDREGFRVKLPYSPKAVDFDITSQAYLQLFDEFYANFFKDVHPKEEKSIGEMMGWIRKGPISKRDMFEKLGWMKPVGWSIYRNKLHKLGVLSRKTDEGFVYYLPEHSDIVVAGEVKKVHKRTLF